MLARIRKTMEEKDQGFTLIELLVVIIIIGILAAIAIPVFLNQRKKGVDASMKSDLKSGANAVETVITDDPVAAIPLTAPAGFKASPGNKVQIAVTGSAGAQTYCLRVENAGSTHGAGKYMYYNSAAGGVQKFDGAAGAGVCADAGFTGSVW